MSAVRSRCSSPLLRAETIDLRAELMQPLGGRAADAARCADQPDDLAGPVADGWIQ